LYILAAASLGLMVIGILTIAERHSRSRTA
jgi:hypothetical protein